MEIDLNKNSYVLTINDSRYEKFCKVFKAANISLPNRFDGFTNSDIIVKKIMPHNTNYHHVLCGIGHFSIIQLAYRQMLPYVIVFEDDAYPCVNINEKFKQLIDSIKDINWDILYLGITGEYTYSKDAKPFTKVPYEIIKNNSNILHINDFTYSIIDNKSNIAGTHAYIIKKQAYLKVMNYILNTNMPVDQAYSASGLKVLFSNKLLFIQTYDLQRKLFIYPMNYDINEVAHGPIGLGLKIPKGFN